MNLRKGITALAATTTLAGLATLGLTVPAQAASQHQTMVASGGTAPACIHRQVHTNLGYVRVSNWCGKEMAVEVLTSGIGGGDSPCFDLPNGQAIIWNWVPGVQSYHKTVVC
jgi:hypothetical protein